MSFPGGNLRVWSLIDLLIQEDLKKQKYKYIYTWGNNPKRAKLKGKTCRIIARGKLNSVLVEFENGQREIVSRNAIRTIQ